MKVGIPAERGIARFLEASAIAGEAGMLLAAGKAGSQALNTLKRALTEVKAAQTLIRQAQATLRDYVHWLEAHRDQEYEECLQRAGFRGSYLILAEYKAHLDRLDQTLTGVVEKWPLAVQAAKEGVFDEFLRDFSPGVNSALRLVCFECIETLTFMHRVAETRYVFLDYRSQRGGK